MKGKRKLSCKNQTYTIEPGVMMLFNPRDNHTCEQIDQNTLDYRCLNIKEEIMLDIVEEITGTRYLPYFRAPVVFHADQVELLKEVHEMIMDECQEFSKEEQFLFLIEQLISHYALPAESMVVENNHNIQKVCDYVKEHYAQTITLDELSKVSGLNKFMLLRTFTKSLGVTPYQYLQTIRINKAKELLELGKDSLWIAMATGFTDQSHFTNFFKKLIGITPGQYKDMFKDRNEERHE
jgi:AraC-like DNA-binding protein